MGFSLPDAAEVQQIMDGLRSTWFLTQVLPYHVALIVWMALVFKFGNRL
jgi:hypothetical protein